jgi:hypothetical protein
MVHYCPSMNVLPFLEYSSCAVHVVYCLVIAGTTWYEILRISILSAIDSRNCSENAHLMKRWPVSLIRPSISVE